MIFIAEPGYDFRALVAPVFNDAAWARQAPVWWVWYYHECREGVKLYGSGKTVEAVKKILATYERRKEIMRRFSDGRDEAQQA